MSGLIELYFEDENSKFNDQNLLIEKDCFVDGHPQFKLEIKSNYDIFGLGETPGAFKRNITTCAFYNTDNPGHKEGIPMYKHLPIIMLFPTDDSHKNKYLIWTNSKQRIEFYCYETRVYIKCFSSGHFSLNVLQSNNLSDLYKKYFELMGRPFKPPMWSLGYHQSKYSYYSKWEVKNLINNFRRLEIPLESVWLDIDYMKEYRVFTVDYKKYGKLKNMIMEKRLVTILDPAIKLGYEVEKDGTDNDIWVKNHKGDNLIVTVWAGESLLPDYTMEKCRDWWSNKVGHFINKYNVSGLWIDMNEPSVFHSDDNSPDPKAIHRADEELGGVNTHDQYHNMYGYLMSKATYKGMINARTNIRPFILTRSTTLGGQKYAAVWTGDNNSSWIHLHESIRMCLNLSLSGIPFSGVDIGGFLENTTDELFCRWMGIGAWLPFFRNHTNNFTRHQEIWSFSDKSISISKEAIYRRYKLMRYFYTQIVKTNLEFDLFLKPIFWDDTIDKDIANWLVERSFIIGSLVIVCDTSEDLTQPHFNINGYKEIQWKNNFSELPKVYLKDGKLLYKNSHVMDTDGLRKDYNLNIIINKDESNRAEEYFYYDDGDGLDDRFWYGKIIYDNGNLTFQKIDGNLTLPKFCCQIYFV